METIENIVERWLYGILTQTVRQSIITTVATTIDVRKSIEDLFHENKVIKAIELDDELWNIQLGYSTIMEYCNHIKAFADLLENIWPTISDRHLVTYALNGLFEKYAHVKPTI